ncbi:MAG: hypothetical protein ACI84C_002211 [Flavobacteriales bacterium]|jgi:hypothetical protein
MSDQTTKLEFAFQKRNYILLLIGIVIVILGFTLMSGGGSDDPNVFKGDYELNDASFEQMSGQFHMDGDVVAKLEPLRNIVYAGEIELADAAREKLGVEVFDQNYYGLRSATKIHADIFSARRITVAPIVSLLGYGFILYAIMWKPRKDEELV